MTDGARQCRKAALHLKKAMTLEVETGRSCYPFAPESQRVRISAQTILADPPLTTSSPNSG
jgi:hypothetical protein